MKLLSHIRNIIQKVKYSSVSHAWVEFDQSAIAFLEVKPSLTSGYSIKAYRYGNIRFEFALENEGEDWWLLIWRRQDAVRIKLKYQPETSCHVLPKGRAGLFRLS